MELSRERDRLKVTRSAFGDAYLNTPLGCPAFVPGFPLCGHGRIPNVPETSSRADMARAAIILQQ